MSQGKLALRQPYRLTRLQTSHSQRERGWIGVTPRAAYLTTDITVRALVPAWLFLLIAAGLMLGAWLREGRQ